MIVIACGSPRRQRRARPGSVPSPGARKKDIPPISQPSEGTLPAQLPACPLPSAELSAAPHPGCVLLGRNGSILSLGARDLRDLGPSQGPSLGALQGAQPLPWGVRSSCNLPQFCFCLMGEGTRGRRPACACEPKRRELLPQPGSRGTFNSHRSRPPLHCPAPLPHPSVPRLQQLFAAKVQTGWW